MMDLVKKFFGKGGEDDSEGKRGQRTHDIRIATCALLLEMAHIDGEFSPSERERIISIVKGDFGLSDAYAKALVKTSHEELEGSIDLWQFTNLINQNYAIEEKIRIIESVWEVAFRDGILEKHEDYLMHKLANLLRLSHKQLIDAKLNAKKSAAECNIQVDQGGGS
ncbi:MAG: TerB family tellurite resistance protein [Deltaproteobacteria bacterium]|nr:TerB family tellurite resistance protein [Deltaproteobacteria bacterium]